MRFVTFSLSLLVVLMFSPGLLALEQVPLGFTPAIPPGQEDLLLGMLGKEARLPDGCKLETGLVDHDVVEATYQCRLGEVVVELIHSSQGAPTDVQTEFFAIAVIEGSASENLTKALQARIQSREADFEWIETDGVETPED